jgi:nucleoside-diphosphate-sugar epimerase
MKVLITGATGLLGRHMVDVLRVDGVSVRIFARPSSDVRPLQMPGQELDIVRGTAEDDDSIRRVVAGVEYIFHLAGHLSAAAPFSTNGGSPLYERINVDFTSNLLAAAAAAGVGRFVFASSSSVYDPAVPVPTPEDARLAPESAYGRSKVAAEARVMEWHRRGMATTIVRPALIYKAGDRHFMPMALSLARLPVLPLVNGGRTLFDMIYAQDVAELMWRAAQANADGCRIYNAGPGSPTTLEDLVAAFRRLTGRGPRIVPVSSNMVRRFRWLARPLAARLAPGAEVTLSPRGIELMSLDLFLDMRRAADELGFRPRFSLEEGLRLTLGSGNGGQ